MLSRNMTRRGGPGHVGIGFVQPKNGRAMFTINFDTIQLRLSQIF